MCGCGALSYKSTTQPRRIPMFKTIAFAVVFAASAITFATGTQAAAVRCNSSPSGWCDVRPINAPYRQQGAVRAQYGYGVGYRESGYRTTVESRSDYRGPAVSDPDEVEPYAGARRDGGCKVPGAVYDKET